MPKQPATPASGLAQRRKTARDDSSAEYLAKRRQLVAAAAEVFHRKGFSDTNLKDIAEAAGTDRATVYYYVTSKQELFVEVMGDSLRDLVDSFERTAATDDAPRERLRELVRALFRGYAQHYPHLYVYVQEDLTRLGIREDWQAGLAALAGRIYEIFRAVLVEGLGDGTFRSSLPPGVIAQTFIGAVARSATWYDPAAGADPEALGDGLAALLVDGVAVVPAQARRRTPPKGPR
jgi:AcrR family transcriptional regulator